MFYASSSFFKILINPVNGPHYQRRYSVTLVALLVHWVIAEVQNLFFLVQVD